MQDGAEPGRRALVGGHPGGGLIRRRLTGYPPIAEQRPQQHRREDQRLVPPGGLEQATNQVPAAGLPGKAAHRLRLAQWLVGAVWPSTRCGCPGIISDSEVRPWPPERSTQLTGSTTSHPATAPAHRLSQALPPGQRLSQERFRNVL